MTGKLEKKTNQAEFSPSPPTCTQRKSAIFRLWPSHLKKKKRHTSSSQPSKLFTRTRWQKGRDRTPSLQRHTMFKLYQKFRRKQTSQLHSEGHHSLLSTSVTQDALRTRTSDVSCRLHAFPRTTCPGRCGSSRLPLPPPRKEVGDCVAGSLQPDDEQRVITHVVFTRAACRNREATVRPPGILLNHRVQTDQGTCFHFFG